jgi:hypothetical protein
MFLVMDRMACGPDLALDQQLGLTILCRVAGRFIPDPGFGRRIASIISESFS